MARKTLDPDTSSAPAQPQAGAQTQGGLLVGIGASAGALDALERFFSHVPAGSGLCFIVVQHLDRHHPSLLADLLAKRTHMPVRQAENGLCPEPDRVYIIPPNARLTLERGLLQVVRPLEASTHNTVDAFFCSLAEEVGSRAVGIILSGTGTDGTVGLRAIKEHGGMTLAQSPGSAKYDGMPQNAISAGLVDVVAAVEDLPTYLLEYQRCILGVTVRIAEALDEQIRRCREQICQMLEQRTGHDFRLYKNGTLLRRIRRRVQLSNAPSAASYLGRLKEDPKEIELLLKDLLIGVTQFFRDPDAFQALATEVLPSLLAGKPAEAGLRIWVPGCSSGEEAYSIAMLVCEHLDRSGDRRPVQIFATDIDADMLARARLGRYPEEIAEQIPPARLQRFFTREGGAYLASRELREMCLFSEHNLIRDPPFSSLDLISCRNLLIYLEAELQRKLVPLFHYALRPDGYLFLGPSEGLVAYAELFRTVDKKRRIFQRKETPTRPTLELPLFIRGGDRSTPVLPPPDMTQDSSPFVNKVFERMLLEEYVPPCAVINEEGDILCLAGRTSRYLQPPAGAPTQNILDQVRGNLRLELRTALLKASKSHRKVVRESVTVDLEDKPAQVRLTIRPLPGASQGSGLYVLLLQEAALSGEEPEAEEETGSLRDQPLISHLEDELRTTRADLQAVVEELESSNEELKSSNEELISANEELQSSNEELQTSKEEIQSVNEELHHKVEELARANSDLANFFTSTNIATLFLDRNVRITKFTPALTALLRLVETDVGRPLSDFTSRFEGADLLGDIQEVLRTEGAIERQVHTADDAWFILRVLPYRTRENLVGGVVVTFVDVTLLKRTELALQRRTEELEAARRQAETEKRRLEAVMEALPVGVAITDVLGGNVQSNRAFEEIWGGPRPAAHSIEDYAGYRAWWSDGGQEVQPEEWASAIAVQQGEAVVGQMLEIRRFDGSQASIINSAAPVRDADGVVIGSAVAIQDITELRRAQQALRESERLYRAIGETIDYGVWVCAPDGRNIYASESFLKLVGLTQEQCSNFGWGDVLHPDDAERTLSAWKECVRSKGKWAIEHRFRGVDGLWHPILARGVPVTDERGEVVCWAGINLDISQLKETESELRDALAQAETGRRTLDALMESIPEGITLADAPDMRIRIVSRFGQELLGGVHDGLTAEQVAKQWTVYQSDGKTPMAHEDLPLVRTIQKGETVRGHELVQVNSAGRALTLLCNAAPIRNARGEITGGIVAWRDISERKQSEHRLTQLSRLYAVLSKVNELIVRTRDPDLLYREVCRIVAEDGERPLVWIGLVEGRTVRPVAASGPCTDYVRGLRVEVDGDWGHGPSGTAVREGRIMVNDDFDTNPSTLPWREPALRYNLRASAAFPLWYQGSVIGVLTLYGHEPGTFDPEQIQLLDALSADISYALETMAQERALRESERTLRAIDQRKNEFLAVLSHELRNPLAPIRNCLYILERAAPGSEQAERAKAILDRQVGQLTRLVDDLLDVTRIARGKIQVQCKRIELTDLLRKTAEDHRSTFSTAGVELDVRLQATPLFVNADAARLAQAVGNLLQNAAKFTGEGGSVLLSVEEERDLRMAVIRVRDNGIGMDPEVLPRLFQPFMQVESTLDRSRGGLGLGLALVKGLAEMHGGSVEARSEGRGKGAEFILQLPLDPGECMPAPELPVTAVSAPRRVLIVEDNADAASSLREALEAGGHRVEVACDGPSGLERARRFKPEVIFCDIGLPGMNGYELAREIREDPEFGPVFLVSLSGYALPEDYARAQEAGFDQHLAKPADLEALERILAMAPRAKSTEPSPA